MFSLVPSDPAPRGLSSSSLCVLCCQGHHDHQPLEERQLRRELAGGAHLAGGGGGGAGHQEMSGHGVHVRNRAPVWPKRPWWGHQPDVCKHTPALSCLRGFKLKFSSSSPPPHPATEKRARVPLKMGLSLRSLGANFLSDAGFRMEANDTNSEACIFSGCVSLQPSRHYQLERETSYSSVSESFSARICIFQPERKECL